MFVRISTAGRTESTSMDIEVIGYGLIDMSLDIQAARHMREDINVDVSAYFQLIENASLNVDCPWRNSRE